MPDEMDLQRDDLNLKLPPGLSDILLQLSLVIARGAAPYVGDLLQQIIPTMMVSAAQTFLAASGAVLPQCPLAPPPVDTFVSIDARTKSFRIECKHSPPHCWDLNGKPGTC
jgi:hypothetical protein